MASVFLSYDHDDKALATPLASALEAAGHTVWYDRHIHGGAQYSRKIEQALDAADAVVVLWTERSLDSAWVRDEAAEGRDRGKLVPLSVGGVSPPMGFRQFQTIDLGAWKGRGKVPRMDVVLEAVDSQSAVRELATEPLIRAGRSVRPRASGLWGGWNLLAAAGLLALVAIGGTWLWLGRNQLPVVEVTAADNTPRSGAAAKELFVKLGSLAQVGQGQWQLLDSTGNGSRSDLIFRIGDTGSDARPRSNLVLMDGKRRSLLWSGEFAFPAGKQADLRQLESLTAGRVLGCALETRSDGGLSADLRKMFLDACASLADLSGEDYGPVTAQLRRVVERAPQFKPAWSRLVLAESIALEYAKYTGASAPLAQQLATDLARARKLFPELPELAIAQVKLRDHSDYARNFDTLTNALERAPDNPPLLAELGNANLHVGRMEDAISNARRAAELDPLSVGGTTQYIMSLAHGGQIDAARNELAKAETLWAGTGALRDAQLAFAVRYGDPALAMKFDPPGSTHYRARAEPSPANIARLKDEIDAFRTRPVSAAKVGWAIQALAEFGMVDDAYFWMARQPNKDLADISYILFRPALASVRRDPRFMPLTKRIGLLQFWQKTGKWPDFCRAPDLPYDCETEASELTAARRRR